MGLGATATGSVSSYMDLKEYDLEGTMPTEFVSSTCCLCNAKIRLCFYCFQWILNHLTHLDFLASPTLPTGS